MTHKRGHKTRRGGNITREQRVARLGAPTVPDAVSRVTGDVPDVSSNMSLFKKKDTFDPFKAEDADKRMRLTSAGRTEAQIKSELKALDDKLRKFEAARYVVNTAESDKRFYGNDFKDAKDLAAARATVAEAERDEKGVRDEVKALKEELTAFNTNAAGGKRTRKLRKGFMVRRVCAISIVPVGVKTRRRKQ
jgi:hypothetical protein